MNKEKEIEEMFLTNPEAAELFKEANFVRLLKSLYVRLENTKHTEILNRFCFLLFQQICAYIHFLCFAHSVSPLTKLLFV